MKNDLSSKEPCEQNKKKKSLAKAAGLKSTFVVNNDIFLTSNGKGNSAIIEKRIVDEKIENLNIKQKFIATNDTKYKNKVNIKSVININKSHEKITAVADKPETGIARQNLLKTKERLEKKYFGQAFNDNIHVQIIYNILDIQKILSVHSNNIVVTIDNLFHEDEVEYSHDFAGGKSTNELYEKLDLINKNELHNFVRMPHIGYFGDILKQKYKEDDEVYYKRKYKEDDEVYYKRIYNILALLGSIRQSCNHAYIDVGNKDKVKTDAWLFNLENPEYMNKEFYDVLDLVYKDRFDSMKKDFLKTSGVNIQIVYNALCALFDTENRISFDDIIKEYYKFTIPKNYKNIGFSIKLLREKMLENEDAEFLKSDSFNSVRSKLYKAIDFIIYYFYTKVAEKRVEDNVDCLRSSINELDKDRFYTDEGSFIWGKIRKVVINNISKDVKTLPKDKKVNENFYNDYKNIDLVDFSTACGFSKLMFLVTKFLDGKEINDLITTLIKKFDNIQSLINVLNDLDIPCEFKSEYKFFLNSGEVCQELRVINSVARMTKPDESAKKEMYKDALEILGIPESTSEEQIEKVLQDITGYDDKGQKTKKRGENGFRNFIASNVIESDRFKYLIRYSNPKKVRALASNENVVLYALSKIPESQIDRYFKRCGGEFQSTAQEKVQYLTKKITGISYTEFVDVDNRANIEYSSPQAADKIQKQTLISLYLTIMYHIIKNLVYVNSRYAIAFYCVARDAMIINNNAFEESTKRDYFGLDLTRYYINNDYLNEYAKSYIKKNIDNISDSNPAAKDAKAFITGDSLIKTYRNYVAHLTVVRNADVYISEIREFHSYFELYHFLLQKILKGYADNGEKTVSKTVQEYFDCVDTYKTYCKDFVKALNAPFGYCLARYKNLSIEPLFDKNNMRISSGQAEWESGK